MAESTTGVPAWKRPWWIFVCVVIAGIVAAGLVRGLVVQSFVVPTESMEPTIAAGQRIYTWRPDALRGSVQRGDVVVIDGRGSFLSGRRSSPMAKMGSWFGVGPRDVFYVKRVIGTGGDTIECCTAAGQLRVNGHPLDEPYVTATRASATDFTVRVPPGRVWLMGDNREHSLDSRNLLGKPGGGMIRESEILGVVIGHGSSVDR